MEAHECMSSFVIPPCYFLLRLSLIVKIYFHMISVENVVPPSTLMTIARYTERLHCTLGLGLVGAIACTPSYS